VIGQSLVRFELDTQDEAVKYRDQISELVTQAALILPLFAR
jgi:hypothetical protein